MCGGGGNEWIEGKKFNQSTFGGLEIFQTTFNPPNYKKCGSIKNLGSFNLVNWVS